ncbi:MAG: glycosyltransferase family 2 protein [Bacteroidota bacterium]
MKISLITVTYNSARFLEDCIKSVIMQDYHNIEHIIVDGGSNDGSVAIIEKYSDHISKWISEKDNGMYDAINKGMAMATGDVIGILNSDDILASTDVMSSIAKTFKENNVDSIYGDLAYVEQMDTGKIHRFWKGNSYKRSRFMFGWMPAHPTFYVKKDVVDKFGGYESHFYTAADYEFMARYLFMNKVTSYYIPKLLVRMRIGGMSNNNLKSRFRANRRDFLAMKKNKIPFPFIVSILKPLRKLPQYFKK